MIPSPRHPMIESSLVGQVPVGSVVAYAGAISTASEAAADVSVNIEQTGWMLCDGRKLHAVTYPELFATLGYAYGGGGDSFAIPDYRDVATGLPGISYLIRFTYGIRPLMGSPL